MSGITQDHRNHTGSLPHRPLGPDQFVEKGDEMTSTLGWRGRRGGAWVAAACGLAIAAGAARGQSGVLQKVERGLHVEDGGGVTDSTGPDVIVGDIYEVMNFGVVNGVIGYTVGTRSCNVGTQDLLWLSYGNQHPVIAQNMYRVKSGKIEQ